MLSCSEEEIAPRWLSHASVEKAVQLRDIRGNWGGCEAGCRVVVDITSVSGELCSGIRFGSVVGGELLRGGAVLSMEGWQKVRLKQKQLAAPADMGDMKASGRPTRWAIVDNTFEGVVIVVWECVQCVCSCVLCIISQVVA